MIEISPRDPAELKSLVTREDYLEMLRGLE
jgi:hypothetical protein